MLMEDRIHFYLGNYLIHTKNIDVTIFPKIKTLKYFNFKTREKLKRNKFIKDIQEFDKQVFEYKDGGN